MSHRPAPRILEVATLSKFFDWFLIPLADRLRARGWRVDGLAAGAPSDPTLAGHFDRLYDATWSRNPFDAGGIVPMMRRLRRLVRDEGYDIVHAHTPVAAFVTRLALRGVRQEGVRVIYTAHGFHFHDAGHPLRNAAFLAAEWLAGRWTDALVVINADDAAAARRYRIVPPERLHHLAGIGVDARRFDPDAVPPEATADLRRELEVPPDAPLLLCLAELIPRKRHADLLAAFAMSDHADTHLVIAGEGPLLPDLRARAQELGCADRVRFVGFRRDVPTLIAAADVVVLVSAQEGLPRCLLEAMSMAAPIVATDIRGSRDLVAGIGTLVPVGDVGRIRAAIDATLSNLDEARDRAREGRRRVLREHDERLILERYEDILTSLLPR